MRRKVDWDCFVPFEEDAGPGCCGEESGEGPAMTVKEAEAFVFEYVGPVGPDMPLYPAALCEEALRYLPEARKLVAEMYPGWTWSHELLCPLARSGVAFAFMAWGTVSRTLPNGFTVEQSFEFPCIVPLKGET